MIDLAYRPAVDTIKIINLSGNCGKANVMFPFFTEAVLQITKIDYLRTRISNDLGNFKFQT